MSSFKMGSLPSMRKQQLFSEFAGLKQACPEGVFVSFTPGDPTVWTGILFIRKGPYCPAVLRFQISFPDSYPQLPPIVAFSSDMFHPLITPLTTYMYTTDIQDSGTVSASDQERLPPGGFSLRHGFPQWFGRGRRSLVEAKRSSAQQASSPDSAPAAVGVPTPSSATSAASGTSLYSLKSNKSISVYEILRYIRSAFDEEEVLDSVPLTAAGNPGAWHAWRTHRRAAGKFSDEGASTSSHQDDQRTEEKDEVGKTQELENVEKAKSTTSTTARHPGEWNWDGVWEDRVKKGIAASLSEPVLYGETNKSDDLIRFLAMEDNDVDSVKENICRTLGETT